MRIKEKPLKKGDRVLTIKTISGDNIWSYGYGTYVGMELCPKMPKNEKKAKIILDNGNIFWSALDGMVTREKNIDDKKNIIIIDNNDFLNDDIKDALIERDGFRQQVEDLTKILKEIHLYLVGRFNETQDTKYLDDLIKFQEMCGDYYG